MYMEDNEAIAVMQKMLEGDTLSKKEKEAITVALRFLILANHTSESYLKKVRAKRESRD